MEKDVGLRIRVQRELREQFLAACHAEDKPAAQVLREFMRNYVVKIREQAAIEPKITTTTVASDTPQISSRSGRLG